MDFQVTYTEKFVEFSHNRASHTVRVWWSYLTDQGNPFISNYGYITKGVLLFRSRDFDRYCQNFRG